MCRKISHNYRRHVLAIHQNIYDTKLNSIRLTLVAHIYREDEGTKASLPGLQTLLELFRIDGSVVPPQPPLQVALNLF